MARRSAFHAVALALLACVAACGVEPAVSTHVPTSAAPARPTLTYLGVAGWQLRSSAGTLLVDPYVTRAAGEDESAPLVPNAEAIAAYIPLRADVVLVGHSHYDHLLDVPDVAKRTGALVVGTESTANVARASGLRAERVRVVHGGDALQVGPFAVRVVSGLHSLTGQPNVPIPSDIHLPMVPGGYGEGGTLQYLVKLEGHTILFVGTANFIEEEVTGLRPDIAVIAIGLRQKIPDYTCRLLRALGRPKLVFPNHFDAHREPLRDGKIESSPDTRAELDAFAKEVQSCAPGTRVVVPVHLVPNEI